MKCCSNCSQGRKECPTPVACCMAADEDDLRCAKGVIAAVAACLALVVAALFYWSSL